VLVTPGGALVLRTPAGRRLRALDPGAHVLRLRDRSRRCGLLLRNGARGRRTGAAFTGVVVWRVTLRAGALSLRCGARRLSVPVA
jgi:hypothetical protein